MNDHHEQLPLGIASKDMRPMTWTIKRAVPLVVLAAFLGGLAGGLRWIVDFFPGLQGMLAGGLLGYFAGLAGKTDPPTFWRAGQRFWLLLNLQLTFVLVLLVVLGVLNAPPLSGHFAWLREVLLGFSGEAYFGASVWGSMEGQGGELRGWAWVFFNLLDGALFLFLGLIVFGTVIDKANEERGIEPEDIPSTTSPARRFFLFQWSVVAVALVAAVAAERSPGERRFDSESIAKLRALTGRYTFEDGGGVLAPAGSAGAFLVTMGGTDTLVLTPEGKATYMLSLRGEFPSFSGQLHTGRTMTGVRARFCDEGESLTLAGRVQRSGARRDVVVEAQRDRDEAASQ